MGKGLFVIDNLLCSGCRNCEVWCSLGRTKDEFNPKRGRIRVWRDPLGKSNAPLVDCSGEGCTLRQKEVPVCVEMCPTGALIYTDIQTLMKRREEYWKKREENPVFRLIAPWKYPYPARKSEFSLREV